MTKEPDMAKARGAVEIEGSIYDGFSACVVRDGKTVAQVVDYADALAIQAALTPSPAPGEVVEDDPIGRAEAWLRQCSAWLLSNDLDMQCPMKADPLDIADDLARHRERFAGVDGGRAANCSCAEVYGEDPRCIKHGRGTEWFKLNPDICWAVEKAGAFDRIAEHLGQERASCLICGAHWDHCSHFPLDQAKHIASRIQADARRIEEMESALRPFVAHAGPRLPDGHHDLPRFPAADIDRARAALAAAPSRGGA